MSSTDPSATWYYGSGTERKGPFSKEQMLGFAQAGVVGTSTLVWSPEMPNWAPFGSSNLAREVPVPAAPASSASALSAPGGQFAPAVAAPVVTGYGQAPRGVSGFGEAIQVCFRKYATFSGRANRPEYWYFVLFYALVFIGFNILTAVFSGVAGGGSPLDVLVVLFSIAFVLFAIAVILPSLAVLVRRLHDTDKSGWWFLISIVPLGGIVLLVFLCQAGTPGRNRFG